MTRRTLRALLALLPCLTPGSPGRQACGQAVPRRPDPGARWQPTGRWSGPGGDATSGEAGRQGRPPLHDRQLDEAWGTSRRSLSPAVPDLMSRALVQPKLPRRGVWRRSNEVLARCNGELLPAAQQGRSEFPPVRDMRIGIVTSSPGRPGLPDACPGADAEPDQPGRRRTHNNDAATASSSTGSDPMNTQEQETAVADAAGDNFLALDSRRSAAEHGRHRPYAASDHGVGPAHHGFLEILSAASTRYGCGFEERKDEKSCWYPLPRSARPVLTTISRDTGRVCLPGLRAHRSVWQHRLPRGSRRRKILQQRADFLPP